ncbi:MAG: 23S rRNA (adenine(2503)-C(2))-methyltransferase RlmN [Verrucomicrobiota bacterium]
MPENLTYLTRPELREWLAASSHAHHERDIWTWMYRKGHHTWSGLEAFRPIPHALLSRLNREASLHRPDIIHSHQASDATQKWLLSLDDDHHIESVFIPDPPRGTLCLSSQVGCTLTCSFCHTGSQRLARNLTAGEIVGQVLLARDALKEWALPAEAPRHLTNLVFMGMGEPLYNYEAIADAVGILADPDGLAISKRKITVSTSGVIPAMERCGKELGVNLAVSLHAARDEIRNEIMPINRKYPLAELIAACRAYPGLSNARRILFAYTLLDGVNDTDRDAADLAKLLADIPSKVNLIPFNPWPGAPYRPSPPSRIKRFQRTLHDLGTHAWIRHTRGDDILAACGQLKTEVSR